MSLRKIMAALSVAFGVALLVPTVTTAPASAAAPVAVRTIYYDASQSQEFKAAVDEGAAAWNKAVPIIELKPATTAGQATIRITADNGWPRTYMQGFGRADIVMGRQAVQDGFYPPRIAAHELGHALGLPDNRNGRCDYLMSGHSSPTSCQVTAPHQTEADQVRRNAGGRLPAALAAKQAQYADCFVF
ncbi:snapalysin family zinc-dependent metalloprotease [Actinomadura chibensis]|uniref:Extracellular small neutral protease n=1 Tax=Actinomadura chibensis TaxID=392828 RepID=A0A5D0NI94_9ACTN|nr:snapalysin family zinc-dependent metalloprotease [Actinomadura chibensis]TYB44140.1 snapalysin family zinc-dependent metalloprotease [Actinomadura chibensis]